ncbi:MAG: tetratricopeptide repeat protein [Chloroflexi bacterium]|nr:tetratricopeptide repeat protein [Chloroflexota bacterium]
MSSDSYLPSRATVLDGAWALSLAIASHITDTDDHRTAARSASEAILSSRSASPVIVNIAHAALAIIAVQQGDTEAAEDLYSALKPLRGTMSGCGLISSDRILGMLAQTMGNHDDSQTHFEDALAFCRKAGYRPELAWSLCDYADMLLERNEDGDSDKATAMLDESLAISTELGMRPLMERVLSRREILKA